MFYNQGGRSSFVSGINDPYSKQESGCYSGSLDKSKSAKLYIISPYKRDAAIIRPYRWNNTATLSDDIFNLMKERKNEYVSSIGGFIKKGFFLDRSGASHQAIVPGEEWYEYKSPVLEDHGWRFILIVNNLDVVGPRYQVPSQNRIIYTGFCIGEAPVIKRYGKVIPNEDAVFYITHQTGLSVDEKIDRNGTYTLANKDSDIDYISNDLLAMNVSDPDGVREYFLDPGVILDSTVYVCDGPNGIIETADSSIFASLRSRDNALFKEDAIMNSPKHQANKVMSSLFKTISENDNARILGGNRDNGFILGVDDDHSLSALLTNNLKGGRPPVIKGLDVNEPYVSFRDIINRFPNIVHNIDIFELENGVDDDYGFSELEKAPNLFSVVNSLVKSSAPPIINDCGISDLTFRWASSAVPDYGTIRLNREPELEVHRYATTIPESMEVSDARLKECISQLEKYVFAVVYEMVGEFEVYLNYSAGQKTVVQLQLRDLTDVINRDYVVAQNDLGGIISPMIGTKQDYDAHVYTLESLVQLAKPLRDNANEFNIASEDNYCNRNNNYHRNLSV